MSITGRLSVNRTGEAVEGLEFALAELARAGAQVPDQGRLRQHLNLLKPLVGAASYPADPEVQARVIAALGDAAQFSLVASVMPDRAVAALVHDVTRALGGSQRRNVGETPQPYQFQSQLYFGAMLAASGNDIRVPDGPSMPDFIVPNGTLRHGIEVKRPTSRRKVKRALGKAADQLARVGGRGLLVLDVSDALETHIARVEETAEGPDHWRERFARPFKKLIDDVRGSLCVPSSSAPRRRYDSLAAFCGFATGSVWITSQEDPVGWPEFRAIFHSRRLYRVHDLAYHRGTWLRDMIFTTLKKFVGSMEVTEVD